MEHELKLIQPYFFDVLMKGKNFEIRKDDRDYKVGDILKLKEWTGKAFTRNYITRHVSYILRDCNGLEKGYCILGITKLKHH